MRINSSFYFWAEPESFIRTKTDVTENLSYVTTKEEEEEQTKKTDEGNVMSTAGRLQTRHGISARHQMLTQWGGASQLIL